MRTLGKKNRHLVIGLFLLTLAVSCLTAQGAWAAQKAVLPTIESDYTGSAVAVINVTPPRDKQLNLLPQAISDVIIRTYGNYFYLIGRYGTDSLTKFHIDAPETVIYQKSLPSGSTSSNPHDLVFANADKAYIPMYGLTECWIVNPGDGSKIGSLDLSAYGDDVDGAPEMISGVIVGNKLFILMERQEIEGGTYTPANNGYLAVFDVTTDQEIDTTATTGIRAALKGIEIPGKNPNSLMYLPENDTIYIGCTGKYPSSFSAGSPYLYTGGVVTVNPNTYEAKLLIDDGDADNHPYGAVTAVMPVSATKGYFVGYKGWGDCYLYTFNPTTGEVTGRVEAMDGTNINAMDATVPLDENGMLWIGAGGTAHTLYVLDTATDQVNQAIDTELNPAPVAFCPQTVWAGSNEVTSATGTGAIKVETGNGVIMDLNASLDSDYPDASGKPEGRTFKDGLVGFRADSLETSATKDGETIKVTVTFPSARGTYPSYFVINSEGNFVELDSSSIEMTDDYTVVLSLTDGGNGDQDGLANGVIVINGGWAAYNTSDDPADDGGDGGGGGGGGCFLGLLDN